jgi:hypothetical protein
MALFTFTLFTISLTFAADNPDFKIEQSSVAEGLSTESKTIMDPKIARSLIVRGDADLKQGKIESAIAKYKEAVLKGTAMEAGQAAYKLSTIIEVPTQDKIEMLERVVHMGEAEWAYHAARELLQFHVMKGIEAFQNVANLGSLKYAVFSGKVLFQINHHTASLAAIDILRNVIHTRNAYYACNAAVILWRKSALTADDIQVLRDIAKSLDEVLKSDPLDFGCTANKREIEELLIKYAQ